MLNFFLYIKYGNKNFVVPITLPLLILCQKAPETDDLPPNNHHQNLAYIFLLFESSG